MPNLYGVSNPVILPQAFTTIAGGTIAVPVSSETAFATSPALAYISNGVYYPQIFGMAGFQVGVGTVSALTISAKIGAGADFITQNYMAGVFVSGGWAMVPIAIVGSPSVVPWQGAGSTITLSCTVTGINVAIYPSGTFLYAALYRAPDQ